MPAGEIRFVVDENLLRLGRTIQRMRVDVDLLGEGATASMFASGTLDPEWIPTIADRGLVVITNDRRLRTKHLEARLALDHGLRVVNLHRVGDRSTWDQAVRLLSSWERIEQMLAQRPSGAMWLSVQASGVKELPFMPGAVERDGPRLRTGPPRP